MLTCCKDNLDLGRALCVIVLNKDKYTYRLMKSRF